MSDDHLKACPMCGGAGELHPYWDGGLDHHEVQCAACGLRAKHYRTEAEATAAWNRRAPSLASMDEKLDRLLAPPQVRHAKDLLTRS